MNVLKILFLVTIISYCTIDLNAQQIAVENGLWNKQNNGAQARRIDIPTKTAQIYELDLNLLQNKLSGINSKKERQTSITIPLANGEINDFYIKPVTVMSSELAAKYPQIKTYEAVSFDGKAKGRIDVTPKGFHAMLFTNEGTMYIDPLSGDDTKTYQSYYKHDFEAYSKIGLADDQLQSKNGQQNFKTESLAYAKLASRSSGTELRTYRLAITATGEYTTFHGGTVVDALSAIVTTMNRVNGIYEREVSIRMVLIETTNQLIYTDPSTDPYTNDNADSYINEVQTNIDNVIGNANYDIGHGFSTGAGGLAGQGPCNSISKARGVTGTSNPVGDPYDVDYVAHEIGHQFGANHTFNGTTESCSGNIITSTAYEPGSGTTILAYAGICSPQNIQNNSDPYFHTASYDEILAYSVDGIGNSCAQISTTGNSAPVANAGQGGFTIPISTPFTLTGSASDPDGDNVTFSWEQFDLGPAGAPNSPVGNAPIFRSFAPKNTPSRTFPDISDIISNTQTVGEILPSYTRSLNFRLTARDNKNGGGGVSYDAMTFDVTENAGPFTITSFNTSTTLSAQSNVEINWDVANTNLIPVNCQLVNILLSVDGGLTFPHIIKSNTPNDGAELILIPNLTSSTGRFKIEAADNVFFDLNNIDITIQTPTNPDYSISVDNLDVEICAPNSSLFNIDIGSILNFQDAVTLSVEGLVDGVTAQITNNPVIPGNSTQLELLNTDLGADGTYNYTLTATSGANIKTETLIITIYDSQIETVELSDPLNGKNNVSLKPTLSWIQLPGKTLYNLDLATDINFVNIIQSVSNTKELFFKPTKLDYSTTYYWRVKGINTCQETPFTVGEFNTINLICTQQSTFDIPKIISSNGANTITSELNIPDAGSLFSIKVLNLKGTHSYISDLRVTITSPLGTEVELFNDICSSNQDFDLNLDDDAINAIISCPPTDKGSYQPSGNLSDFFGEEITGIWTLTIIDGFDLDGGTLENWDLEICVLTNIIKPEAPTDLMADLISDNKINLNWIDMSVNEENFILERSKNDNTNFLELAVLTNNNSSYQDIDFTNNDLYYYRIKAVNAGGSSTYSNEISIFNILPPSPPSDLIVELISLEQVNLSWVNNSNYIEGFIIERSDEVNNQFVELTTLSIDTIQYSDPTLTIPTSYFYRLKAFNLAGKSAYSNEASISSTILSTTTIAVDKISIFPNPSNGKYTMEIKDELLVNNFSITIYDIIGKDVNASISETSKNSYSIDISLKPRGIYFIHLQNDDQIIIQKLIKN